MRPDRDRFVSPHRWPGACCSLLPSRTRYPAASPSAPHFGGTQLPCLGPGQALGCPPRSSSLSLTSVRRKVRCLRKLRRLQRRRRLSPSSRETGNTPCRLLSFLSQDGSPPWA